VSSLAERSSELQGRGVAVFTCTHAGFYEEVVLPTPLRERAVADETPYLRPLLAALDEAHRYLVVVVERGRSWFYEFFMLELEESAGIVEPSTQQPGRPSAHDQDARHVDHRTETLTRKHFHATASATQSLMERTGSELLILGGHRELCAEFAEMLPKSLQSRVAGVFAIDPHTMTPAKVREGAQPIVESYERAEEARLVADLYERVATGGNGAVGLEWCLLATNEKAVETLLVQGDTEVSGRACDNCGWLGLEGDPCPVCGRTTRVTPDVIDDMAAAVITASGDVEHVYEESVLERDLVGAHLRFPVPKPD
jgi:peptide subunit release factor 1 (eRF1)